MNARFLMLPILLVAACGPKYIEGTKIEDTERNREIAELVERYRLAVEHRDLDTLRSMISRDYFANAGTTAESDDDYGYDYLEKKVIPTLRDDVKSVQYRIVLRNITFQGNRAFADYEFWYKFYYVDGGKDRWVSKNNFNRLEFAKEDGVWRIVGGL
ncbi:MAG: nuclear transport factor 2 family protein [Deltaproteobacteria bacterium]|nr:nuclear transport factor 2 family protein [Deltaproteobacteria bacterium]